MSIWGSIGWHKKNPLLEKVPVREQYNGTIEEGLWAHVDVAVSGWNDLVRLSICVPNEAADVYLSKPEVAELIEYLALALQDRRAE